MIQLWHRPARRIPINRRAEPLFHFIYGLLRLETPKGRWSVDLIGKNLTNGTFVTNPGFCYATKERRGNIANQLRAAF